MANHRLIRPGLFVNPGVSTLKIRERYLLIGLTAVANDWGKFWYQANHIRSQVFPTDEIDVDEMNEMLDNIVTRGFICVYESKGVKYAHFPTWRTQGSFLMQYLDKPRPDVDIPNCEKHNNDTVGEILSKFSESSGAIERNGNENNQKEANRREGEQEEKIDEILNPPLVEAMSDRYPTVNVPYYREKYILHYKSRKHIIEDHRRNFEKWLMEEAHKEPENEWAEDEGYYE